MSTSQALKEICGLARPMIEQQLDLTMEIAAIRDLATAKGLDWSQIKALHKAQIQDERDDSGDGRRVNRIVEKAEFASAYADMLGLANMNEKNYIAGSDQGEGGEVDRVAELLSDASLGLVRASDLKKSETQSATQAGSDLITPAPLNGQVASNSDIGNPISNEAPMAVDGDSVEAATAPLSESVDILPSGSMAETLDGADQPPAATNCQPGKSVKASASAAPAAIYAAPGVITWEVAPPEGVQRHDFSAAFADLGQDLVVIGDEIASARAEPIVKIGNVILDGWARYMVARGAIGLDGHSTEYSVVQYDGADPLIDCIKWNLAGRILNETQKRLIAQRLAKLQPKRKNDIYAAMDMGMELVA